MTTLLKMHQSLKRGLGFGLNLPKTKSRALIAQHRRISTSDILSRRFENNKGRAPPRVGELLDNACVEENVEPASPDSVWLKSPYRKHQRDQASHAFRLQGDPSEYSIILFPGQGTQHVGMAKSTLSIQSVRDMFDVASDILKWDLAALCLNGPKEELDKTSKAQPAILVSSLAALELMKEKESHYLENCIATAGFSIGEYAALVFSGVLSFEDSVHLVKARGEAMQEASELVPSGMMTIILDRTSQLGTACHEAQRWCADNGIENPICTVANYLYPHCKVIGGHNEALSFVKKNAQAYNLRRCMQLPVSGAFHTKLMKPAIKPFKKALEKVVFNKPFIPVHCNVDGKRYSSPINIPQLLCKQIISPVKWEQTLHVLTEYKKDSSLPRIYECGPGRSLTTILRMVNNRAECHSYEV